MDILKLMIPVVLVGTILLALLAWFLLHIRKLKKEAEQAAEKIARTSSELEAILQSALVGISYVSERRHQWVNNKLAEMMGFVPEELIGQSTLLHFPDEKSWQALGDLAYPIIKQGTPFSADWELKRKDGSLFWAAIFGKCVDPQDFSKGSIWTYLDITDRKQAEEESKAALEKQTELNYLKSRFISMTSHEFRTPLATIMSSTELLKYYSEKMPAEERLDVLESIEKAVKRMTNMLEDVLVIGKVDAAKIEVQPVPLSLGKFCKELVEEIKMASDDAEKTRCEIEFLIAGDTGDVCFDEKLLHHIFSNLLSNAVKYSPAGGKVFFGVVCRPQEIEFTVADQGIGVASDDVSHLFETFYRASNVGNISGTGLGLAIVKRSVDLCGGSINVDTLLGTGTRFVVTLPTVPAA